MKKNRYSPANLTMTVVLSLLFTAGAVHADDQPVSIGQVPDAVIGQTRQDGWKEWHVAEVECTTSKGFGDEAAVSGSGEILDIEEKNGLPWIGGELTIGIGLAADRGMYNGVDSKVRPVPFFEYHNGPLHVATHGAIDAMFDLYGTDSFTIGLKGALMLDEGYDPDDSAFLKGMDELETLYSAGFSFEVKAAGVEAGLAVMQDISGEHDGQQVELNVAYPWKAAGFEWRPGLCLTWMSSATVEYFYGVSPRKHARIVPPIRRGRIMKSVWN